MASSADTTLWLYTSLSSGSSQIVTATSRLETILKANRIPFKAVDVATDDKARTLWGRRAGKRKLPGLVRMGEVLADINEVEEWNEYGEIKEMLAAENDPMVMAATGNVPQPPPSKGLEQPAVPSAAKDQSTTTKASPTSPAEKTSPKSPESVVSPMAATMQQIGFEAAEKASKVKAKLKSTTGKSSQPSTEPETEPGTSSKETQPKLNDADVVPPSVTDSAAAEAKEPEKTSTEESKAAEDPTIATTTKSETTKTSDPQPEEITAKESAIHSPTSTGEPSSDSMPRESADVPVRRHRGSSISAASVEEVAAVEEATKIKEEPEIEDAQASEGAGTLDRVVSDGAAKQDLVKEPKDTKDDETSPEKGAELAKQAQEKRSEPHIKFVGETPGEEIDRVKATLGAGQEERGKSGSSDSGKLAKSSEADTSTDAVGAEISKASKDANVPLRADVAAVPPAAKKSDAEEKPTPPSISIVEPVKADTTPSDDLQDHTRRVSNPPQMDIKASPTIVPTKPAAGSKAPSTVLTPGEPTNAATADAEEESRGRKGTRSGEGSRDNSQAQKEGLTSQLQSDNREELTTAISHASLADISSATDGSKAPLSAAKEQQGGAEAAKAGENAAD